MTPTTDARDLTLIDAYESSATPALLYRLLEERTPEVNISHRQMPSWEEHLAFFASRPYAAWYLFEANGEPVGAIYLSHADEIGVFVLRAHRGRGYGKRAIELLMERHPRERYLANINPANSRSIAFFRGLGFHHIQNTYEKR